MTGITKNLVCFLSLIMMLLSGQIAAQTVCKDDCPCLIRLGERLAGEGDYVGAIRQYNSAKLCDPSKTQELNRRIEDLFNRIDKLRQDAEKARLEALTEKTRAENNLQRALRAEKSAKTEAENARRNASEAFQQRTISDSLRTISDTLRTLAEQETQRAGIETQKALNALQKLQKAFGDLTDIYVKQANDFIYLLEYDSAVARAADASALRVQSRRPSMAALYLELAYVYNEVGDPQRAALTDSLLAWVYSIPTERISNNIQAEEILNNIQADCKDCPCLIQKGDYLFAKGDLTSALSYYASAITCDPAAEIEVNQRINNLFFSIALERDSVEHKAKSAFVNSEQQAKALKNLLQWKMLTIRSNITLDSLRTILATLDPYGFSDLQKKYYPNMIKIPGGTFQMGSKKSEKYFEHERPAHDVILSDYKMAETEITWWQYFIYCRKRVQTLPSAPSWGRLGDFPVVNVNWYDAVQYLNWLSERLGLTPAYNMGQEQKGTDKKNVYDMTITLNMNATGLRLPTEAEWEYAARAGDNFEYSGSPDINKVAWYTENSNNQTRSVKGKIPNRHGLYDMSGNAWEWCWDWYDAKYIKSKRKQKNPTGPASGSDRVVRGGSWGNNAQDCHVTIRLNYEPSNQHYTIGFRPASTVSLVR